MKRAQSGNSGAFGVLVRRHQRRVYGVVLHILRDSGDAEDITQDAFIRAYRAIDRFDGRSQPYTWFYRIAVNLSLNKLRSRKRRGHTRDVDDPHFEGLLAELNPQQNPLHQASNQQLGVALCRAMDGLSDTLRTTLILVVIDGQSHSNVASILGCPEGTVAWRVHEARKQLRLGLQQLGHSHTGATL